VVVIITEFVQCRQVAVAQSVLATVFRPTLTEDRQVVHPL
jgi:hypothetical protein